MIEKWKQEADRLKTTYQQRLNDIEEKVKTKVYESQAIEFLKQQLEK